MNSDGSRELPLGQRGPASIFAWARDAFTAMHPHLEDAVYVNNLGAEGPERVLAAYRGNHSRLAGLKHTYDLTNVFRIEPEHHFGRARDVSQ
jgi:hypothetical protein